MYLPKVVRGTLDSGESFPVDFSGDLLIALSTSWHLVPLDCGQPVLGLSFTLPVWKSLRSHFKSICFGGGSFLNCCWKSSRTSLIDFPV